MSKPLMPDPSLLWPIDWDGVKLIADFERHPDMGKGVALKSYRCPAGKWTNGWGETDGVGPDSLWTQEYADQRFCDSLADYTQQVVNLLTREASASQLAAMVALAYNIGFGDPDKGIPGFKTSTVLKAHNAGDFEAAANAFRLWNKATVNGKKVVMNGLVRRRAAESALYLRDEVADRMPQVVAGESRLAASPIQQSGVVTVATGAVALAGSLLEPIKPLVKDLTDMASSFGVQPGLLIGAVLLVTGGTTVYWRWRQRREGWS